MKDSTRNGATAVVVVVLVLIAAIAFMTRDTASQPKAGEPQSTATPDASNPSSAVPTEKPKVLKVDGDLTKPAKIDDAGQVRIVSVESVTSEATMPGEISAPAIRVTVEVSAGDKPLDLTAVVVNAYYGKDQTPAIQISGPGVVGFSGTLAAGKKAKGTQVFNVPRKSRNDVTVEVVHPRSLKAAIFRGSVA